MEEEQLFSWDPWGRSKERLSRFDPRFPGDDLKDIHSLHLGLKVQPPHSCEGWLNIDRSETHKGPGLQSGVRASGPPVTAPLLEVPLSCLCIFLFFVALWLFPPPISCNFNIYKFIWSWWVCLYKFGGFLYGKKTKKIKNKSGSSWTMIKFVSFLGIFLFRGWLLVVFLGQGRDLEKPLQKYRKQIRKECRKRWSIDRVRRVATGEQT